MSKIIWLSDLHYVASGDVLGHDPQRRVDAAINYINAHHDDADLCVISGDLVDLGTIENYRTLKTNLNALRCRYLPMVGNHDARMAFKTVFEMPDGCMTDFVQFVTPTSDGFVVCLDTHKSGSDAGEFCELRMGWLTDFLVSAGDAPVYLFMHHPPMPLGLPMQDPDRMEGGSRFLEMLTQFSNVKHLFVGHVHRPICGTISGIPFATMKSVLYQAPAPRPEWNWSNFSPSKEPPSLGVLTINDGDVNLQYTQFCDYAVGIKKLT